MATIPDNFMGIDHELADYDSARFAVLPIPYDATTSFMTGTRDGPRAIITASQQVEWYDHELGTESIQSGIATLDPLLPDVRGPHQMHDVIYKRARQVVADKKFLIGLGGEHSISSALVRAVASKHKHLSVLQIDAHADLRQRYEGSEYSHASVMRRVHDLGIPFIGVGIRNYSLEEARFMKRAAIKPVTAEDCYADDDWIERVLDTLSDTVYVTIDIDGFDPAYAPGTGTPEPGGLSWTDVTALLRVVTQEKKVVAADTVEVTPIPGQVVTEFLAAKLVYKLISYVCDAH